MAKKCTLSVSQRIEVFHMACDSKEPPSIGTVMQRLMEWIPLAQALENGETLLEAKGQIAALEAEKATLCQQYQALQSENEVLKSENKTLQTDNADFQAMLEKANGEISRIQEAAKNSQQEKEREWVDDAVRILVELAENSKCCTLADLEEMLDLRQIIIRHHLDEMRDAGFLSCYHDSDGGTDWKIIKKGRAFLFKKGLLQ